MGRKIKSPTELFEEKRLATLKSLEELKQQKIEEEQNKLLNRRVKSPKEVFGVKEEVSQNTDEIKEIVQEEKEVVVESPLRFITKYYDNEIENLKNNLVELKDSIPVVEKFDSTDLYNHIKSLKELIGKVKEDIPEQILYDDQLKALTDSIDSVRKSIPEVPEVKYYDEEIENIINIINDVRNEIPVVPEIRYYDEQILNLENALNSFPDIKYYDKDIIELQERIEEVRTEIENLPEVKYYDEQIQEIENRISIVKNEIPEVPEVKYYDEQIAELEDKISNIQIPEVKYYDEQIKELQDKIDVVKDNIPEVPEVKYYDEQITELEDKISNIQIPEVKYYDFEIENVLQEVQILKEAVVSFKINETKKVQDLYDSFESETKNISKKISHIEEVFEKFNEKEILNEGLLSEPPEVKNEDPLTPLDKNFVTLDQLQNHYRLFINRVQQQLATIGGGGETRLEFLDDVDRDSAKQDGYVLQYSSSSGKFIGTSYVPGGGTGAGGTSYWVGTNAGIYTTGNVAIGTNVVSSGSTALWVEGDVRITGILSVGQGTVTIDGNNNTISATNINAGNISATSFTGTATTATKLETARTFQITGDVVSSPVSFDGTGNVSFAATIQPNSVALGGDTTGDYVQSVSGTSNQIAVTGGTGEGSTPVISIATNPTLSGNVTITNDLQINNNLNVTGNITIGGTSAYIVANDFRVKDADIVAGFTTDSNGNDASNDTTANHGGIAVASTEGSPLINLYNSAIGEVNPSTYKKFMWFKSGSFTGLNTDTWISNYPISIGTTTALAGSRLSVGAGFTIFDTYVDATDIRARNISASGIVTASNGTLISGVGIGTTTTSLIGTAVTSIIFTGNRISSVSVSSGVANVNIQSPYILTDVSSDGLTIYTGKSVVGIDTTQPYWTVRRTLSSTSGIITSVGTAVGIAWTSRTTATYT